jgi:hypothetical protein
MRKALLPGLSGLADGVQDGKGLVHAGDQGDLLGFALACRTVRSASSRVCSSFAANWAALPAFLSARHADTRLPTNHTAITDTDSAN